MVDYHVETLNNAIDFAQNDCRGFFERPVFRGQRNAEWKLSANLFRYAPRLPYTVTDDFLTWSRGSRILSAFDDEALLQIAQHYGLMTDLLDFTLNPLIACFFALVYDLDDECVAQDSAVFVVDARMLDRIELLTSDDLVGTTTAEVIARYHGMYREGMAIGLSRLNAQEGVFVRDAHGTLQAVLSSQNELLGLAYEERFQERLNYAKLILRRSPRDLDALAKLGITRDKLFPPANPLEREIERFLAQYPDRIVADELAKGLEPVS